MTSGPVVRTPAVQVSRAVVHVSGDLDLMTAPHLRQVLVTTVGAGYLDLVVDLTGVTFLDASGLGVLVAALKRLRAHQGDVALVVGSPHLLKVFTITGLVGVFTIHPELDAVPPAAGRGVTATSPAAVHWIVTLDAVTGSTTSSPQESLASGRPAE